MISLPSIYCSFVGILGDLYNPSSIYPSDSFCFYCPPKGMNTLFGLVDSLLLDDPSLKSKFIIDQLLNSGEGKTIFYINNGYTFLFTNNTWYKHIFSSYFHAKGQQIIETFNSLKRKQVKLSQDAQKAVYKDVGDYGAWSDDIDKFLALIRQSQATINDGGFHY